MGQTRGSSECPALGARQRPRGLAAQIARGPPLVRTLADGGRPVGVPPAVARDVLVDAEDVLGLAEHHGERQLTVLELSSKIQAQVGSEITKAQRDHFLRQQIKAIQDELGEAESDNPELDELWDSGRAPWKTW